MGGGWWGRANAKKSFLRGLHKRAGFPWPLTFEDEFFFAVYGGRWRNIDQLEAVVEFYANFPDPWVKSPPGPQPMSPGDPGYQTVRFRPPEGSSAQLITGPYTAPAVQLDGDADLRWILPNPQPADNPFEAGWVGNAKYPQPRRYLYDTLWLEADTQRPSRLYRIMSVDHQNRMVWLDDDPPPGPTGPVFQGGVKTSRWKINTRPILVVIDPLGARRQLTGLKDLYLRGWQATVDADDPRVVHLDGFLDVDLSRVNKYFDTIRLRNDTVDNRGLPRGAYRIVDWDSVANTVTLDGEPILSSASPWNIPAGLSADQMPDVISPGFPPFTDHFDPPPDLFYTEREKRGHDHYDAALFLVHRGVPIEWYRWTSYTSRDYGAWRPAPDPAPPNLPTWGDLMSSIRGNLPYFFYSWRSTEGTIKNYTLLITDPRASNAGISWIDDTVAPHTSFAKPSNHESLARFYYGMPDHLPDPLTDVISDRVEIDANGKTAVELHRGNHTAVFSGSGGCLVSPSHVKLRNRIIGLYLDYYAEFYGVGTDNTDPYLNGVPGGPTGLAQADNYPTSVVHWGAEAQAAGEVGYNKKLAGIMWLIRPDEPPLRMRVSATGPTVTGLSPATGPAAGGFTVYLSGSNLKGVTKVMFGPNPAINLIPDPNNADTKCSVVAPPGTGTVDVIVTAMGVDSTPDSSRRFTYK